jgi:hypothetical protein
VQWTSAVPSNEDKPPCFDIFDPQQARDRTLPSARSASTFGHHSTFAQAVRFLPFSHLPANFCHFAGTSPLRTPTVRCKRPPSPAPCELCDRSSFIDGATLSSLAELQFRFFHVVVGVCVAFCPAAPDDDGACHCMCCSQAARHRQASQVVDIEFIYPRKSRGREFAFSNLCGCPLPSLSSQRKLTGITFLCTNAQNYAFPSRSLCQHCVILLDSEIRGASLILIAGHPRCCHARFTDLRTRAPTTRPGQCVWIYFILSEQLSKGTCPVWRASVLYIVMFPEASISALSFDGNLPRKVSRT